MDRDSELMIFWEMSPEALKMDDDLLGKFLVQMMRTLLKGRDEEGVSNGLPPGWKEIIPKGRLDKQPKSI